MENQKPNEEKTMGKEAPKERIVGEKGKAALPYCWVSCQPNEEDGMVTGTSERRWPSRAGTNRSKNQAGEHGGRTEVYTLWGEERGRKGGQTGQKARKIAQDKSWGKTQSRTGSRPIFFISSK